MAQLQNLSGFHYRLPSGEVISTTINPSQAATVDLRSVIAGQVAAPVPKAILDLAKSQFEAPARMANTSTDLKLVTGEIVKGATNIELSKLEGAKTVDPNFSGSLFKEITPTFGGVTERTGTPNLTPPTEAERRLAFQQQGVPYSPGAQIPEQPTFQGPLPEGFTPEQIETFRKIGITQIPQVITPPATPPASPPPLPTPTVDTAQATFSATLGSTVDADRATLDTAIKTRLENTQKEIDEASKNIEELTALEKEGIEGVEEQLKPFREKLEKAERERLKITENFEANQILINELGSLLAEGNELIKQQKEITGLAAIRNPRIDKTISDVNARAGVIEAVINARNGQIGQAFKMIDRTVAAISADKQDQLTYYNTLLNFYESQKDTEGKKLVILTKDKKDFLNFQIGLLENDLAQSQANANNIKNLMTDPDTAYFMAKAGVTLNDPPEVQNAKMAGQSNVQLIEDFKNEKLDDGFIFVPNPIGSLDEVTFTIGGNEMTFKAPPDKVTPTSSEGKGFDYATELIRFNPSATENELKTQLQRATKLSAGEINTILAGRFSESQVRIEAEDTVFRFFEKKLFSTRSSELEKAKEKAKENIEEDGTLAQEIKDRIITEIDNVTIEKIQELKKEE